MGAKGCPPWKVICIFFISCCNWAFNICLNLRTPWPSWFLLTKALLFFTSTVKLVGPLVRWGRVRLNFILFGRVKFCVPVTSRFLALMRFKRCWAENIFVLLFCCIIGSLSLLFGRMADVFVPRVKGSFLPSLWWTGRFLKSRIKGLTPDTFWFS